jgi:hypothetical protein
VSNRALAGHVVTLIERSVTSAMEESGLRGKVEVKMLKEVKP